MGSAISKPTDPSFLTITDTDLASLSNDSDTIRKVRKNFPHLVSLVLQHCSLTSIPKAIISSYPTTLNELILTDNLIKDIPPFINGLVALKCLDISNNQLLSIPWNAFCVGLERLVLNANHIAGVFPGDTPTIETELRRLGSLVQLSLSDNNLTVITPAIACLGTLEYLQLENNMISSLPPSIGFLRRLTSLNIGGNGLEALPESIGDLSLLSELLARRNMITHLPASICKLTRLKTLDLTQNALTELPLDIGKLTALKHLLLPHNKLTSLPSSISGLTSLHTLQLEDNQLRKLPAEVGALASLTNLELEYNRLTTLPVELEYLKRLTKLNASFNQLSQLPPGLASLPKLSTLILSNNEFETLPKELLCMRLYRLSLDGNPFNDDIRAEIERIGGLTFVRQVQSLLDGTDRSTAWQKAATPQFRVSFDVLLDNLYTKEDMKERTRSLTHEQQWHMFAQARETGPILVNSNQQADTTAPYLAKLKKQPTAKDIQELRVQLTSQPRSWLHQFYMRQGLDSLLDLLFGLSSVPDCLLTEEQSRKQLELLRCIRLVFMAKFQDILTPQCRILQVLALHLSCYSNKGRVVQIVLEILLHSSLTYSSFSMQLVMDAISEHHRVKQSSHSRFYALSYPLKPQAADTIEKVILLPLRITALTLINTILANTDELEARCSLRQEITQGDFEADLYVLLELELPELSELIEEFFETAIDDYEDVLANGGTAKLLELRNTAHAFSPLATATSASVPGSASATASSPLSNSSPLSSSPIGSSKAVRDLSTGTLRATRLRQTATIIPADTFKVLPIVLGFTTFDPIVVTFTSTTQVVDVVEEVLSKCPAFGSDQAREYARTSFALFVPSLPSARNRSSSSPSLSSAGRRGSTSDAVWLLDPSDRLYSLGISGEVFGEFRMRPWDTSVRWTDASGNANTVVVSIDPRLTGAQVVSMLIRSLNLPPESQEHLGIAIPPLRTTATADDYYFKLVWIEETQRLESSPLYNADNYLIELREKPLRLRIRMFQTTTEVMSFDPSCTILAAIRLIGKRMGPRSGSIANCALYIERLHHAEQPMSGWLDANMQLKTYNITEADTVEFLPRPLPKTPDAVVPTAVARSLARAETISVNIWDDDRSTASVEPPTPETPRPTVSLGVEEELEAAEAAASGPPPPPPPPPPGYLTGSLQAPLAGASRMKLEQASLYLASINELVLTVTSDREIDRSFMDAFFNTYRSFCTPSQLLEKLIERYNVPDWVAPETKSRVQIRVLVSMRTWCAYEPRLFAPFVQNGDQPLVDASLVGAIDDGDKEAQSTLGTFLARARTDGYALLVERMCDKARNAQVRVSNSPPESKLPKNLRGTKIDLFTVDSEELARQLCIHTFQIYSKIQPFELVGQVWSKDRELSRNVNALITWFNLVSGWVSTSIVQQKTLRMRVKVITQLVEVNDFLCSMNNFLLVMAVVSGISHSAISRLKWTLAKLPKKFKKSQEKLESLMSMEGSYKNYRFALKQSFPPCIPYIGVFLQDLTFIEDGNPTFYEGQVNFSKCWQVYNIIATIQRFQTTPYNFVQVDEILRLVTESTPMSDSQLYEESLKLEPRNALRTDIA